MWKVDSALRDKLLVFGSSGHSQREVPTLPSRLQTHFSLQMCGEVELKDSLLWCPETQDYRRMPRLACATLRVIVHLLLRADSMHTLQIPIGIPINSLEFLHNESNGNVMPWNPAFTYLLSYSQNVSLDPTLCPTLVINGQWSSPQPFQATLAFSMSKSRKECF